MAHTPTTNLLACIPIVEIMILKKGLNNEREDPQSLQLCVLFRKKRCPFFVEQVRQAYPIYHCLEVFAKSLIEEYVHTYVHIPTFI